ncbi:MAG: GGDEF domain-containing protein [Henriciella sp.]|nr:GGDEF domain-containing protein [Henriciella sp.]
MDRLIENILRRIPAIRIQANSSAGIMAPGEILRRRIVMMSVFGFVAALGFTLLQIAFFGFSQSALPRIATGILGSALCTYGIWLGLWSEKYENSLRFLLLIFSALVWTEVFLSGGITSYNAAILPIFPVVAALLLKPKDALLFTGLHIAVIVVIAHLDPSASLLPILPELQEPTLAVSVAMLMAAVIVCAGSALYMAHQNQKVEGQLRELLIHQAYLSVHDYLSGLGNRVQLQQRFTDSPDDDEFDLLLIDLDGFKAINDTYGHEAGDDLIKSVSDRLREFTEDQDLAVRLGGDEFVILLQDVDMELSEIRKFATAIIEAISRPYPWNNQILRISASIGHARYPLHADSPGRTLGLADQALYKAKNAGKGRCVTHGQRPRRAKPKKKRPFILPAEPHSRLVE